MPLHFAFGSFYMVSRVLDEKIDCRNLCTPMDSLCANYDTLMLADFFLYSGVGLIMLSIVFPLIISYRNKPQPLKLLS